MATGGIRRITKWTAAEDAVLAEHFPGGGAEACRRALPHRTRYAINMRIHVLGIRRAGACAPQKPAWDHRALARALGVPAQTPDIPFPSHITVHPCR